MPELAGSEPDNHKTLSPKLATLLSPLFSGPGRGREMTASDEQEQKQSGQCPSRVNSNAADISIVIAAVIDRIEGMRGLISPSLGGAEYYSAFASLLRVPDREQ